MSDKDQMECFTDIRLKSYTPDTITNPNDLRKHLAIIKRDGIALDYEERHLDVSSCAAGIRGSAGEVLDCILTSYNRIV